MPVILIREERLEVVPYFRYFGLLDKDNGALGMEIQARICSRMKQRFKEFEGRVFCNTEVSTLPRMQVFKCMILTNGMYAAEVWNYTRADIDRLEKHYFRLLRSTLFMLKYNTTYVAVLNSAREQGVLKIYPIETYVQRQQLKFLWKILHLNDMALQRIMLHGKMDPKYSQGRGGRQRTYKQCIKDALGNVGVTMTQCMDMKQQDWDAVIEGVGMETALQRWEARPKATRPIDVEWRTKAVRGSGQKARTPTAAAAEEDAANMDTDDDIDGASSAAESASEDEFAQLTEIREEKDDEPERKDLTPWEEDGNVEDQDTTGRRLGPRSRYNRLNRNGCSESTEIISADNKDNSQQIEEDHSSTSRVEEEQRVSYGAKRIASAAARNRARRHKNARKEKPTGYYQNRRELQLLVEEGELTQDNDGAVPWEHRGLLGQTRGGRLTEEERESTVNHKQLQDQPRQLRVCAVLTILPIAWRDKE